MPSKPSKKRRNALEPKLFRMKQWMTRPHGVVAPSKTLRICGKNTGSCFAPDAHRMPTGEEILCPPNWTFYRGKCTGVCLYPRRDLQRIICTGLIPVTGSRYYGGQAP